MNLDPGQKICRDGRIEKCILHKAFDTDGTGKPAYFPKHIMWRQKEQLGDEVGYGSIDGLRDEGERRVTDEMLKNLKPEWDI